MLITTLISLALTAPAPTEAPLRVLSFNLWIGGEAGKQPLEQTVKVIQAARADVVGLQETGGNDVNGVRPDNSKRVAAMLGWNQIDQGGGTAIITRFKILETTPLKWGAKLDVGGGRHVWMFNAHLSHAPYQPYQLLGIPYHDGPFIKTEAEAIRFARQSRGAEVDRLLSELKPALWTGLPVFVTGDFNEPSCLDWTDAAAKAGKCPVKVEWPSTKAIVSAGLADALRAVRPDPARDPAHTWTPTTRDDDPKDRHDRIDFVFAGGPATPKTAEIVGEEAGRADIVVTPYPSDHRAVVASFDLALPSLGHGYTIPVVDFADRPERQVIVDRERDQYLGHPTTVLLEDGRTILCVYPKGHGKGALVLKRSLDGGLTWSERLPVPASWATSLETPTIHRLIDAKGVKRLVIFSGLHPIRSSVSEDDGVTWSELKPIGSFGGIVAMASVIELKEAPGRYAAYFHDDGRYFAKDAPPPASPLFTVYKTLTADGGLTWGTPEPVATHASAHLCEPGAVRSPDGRTIALLLRENSRKQNSFVVFSSDEGRTWTTPRELPAALTGDRHVARYAPDGRLLVTFRDTTLDSLTKGDWVAWVGTYDDIACGREGQYRARLLKNHKAYDCAYPGLELLPDGTFVTTSYGHWTEDEQPYIVSVRVKIGELDALVGKK